MSCLGPAFDLSAIFHSQIKAKRQLGPDLPLPAAMRLDSVAPSALRYAAEENRASTVLSFDPFKVALRCHRLNERSSSRDLLKSACLILTVTVLPAWPPRMQALQTFEDHS